MKRTQALACMLFALMMVAHLTGCERPRWDDPDYISQKLGDEDRNTRTLAMNNVANLPDDQLAKVTPGLLKAYETDTVLQKDAMKYLLQVRSDAAIQAYLTELATNNTDYDESAAEVLGIMGDTSAVGKMLEVLKSTDKDSLKSAITRALVKLPVAESVPALVDLLKLDVDRHPISILSYACDALTEVALKVPDAIDEAAVKQVTLAMFYANRTNQTLDKDCGTTVQAFGQTAVPELLKLYRGEREDIAALFLKYDTQDTPYPPNLAKIVAVQRLVTMRAPELGPLAFEDLQKEKAAPPQFTGMNASNWRLKEGQLTSEELYAIGDVGYSEARELLEGVVKGERVTKEWDDITDRIIELQLRQDASFGLVRLGDRAALPSILEGARNGVIIDLERSAKILEKRGEKIKDTERYQLNWMLAQSYANLALPEDREAFRQLSEEWSKKSVEVAAKLDTMLPMFDTVEECHAKPDDAARAKCYGEKLKSDNELVREKAAWELGRLPSEAAAPVLNEAISIPHLNTREVLNFALYRVGDASSLKAVEKLMEDEADKGGNYRLDRYRMNLARLYLANKTR